MDNPKPARLTIAPPDESPAAVEERRRKWYEENKEAIEAYNRIVEEKGLFWDRYELA